MKELRLKYKEVVGKSPFNGWNKEQLIKRINDVSPTINEVATEIANKVDARSKEELERMEEARKINTMQYKLIPEEATPVFLEGKPYCIINNEYMPYEEAVIYIQENKIKKDTEKLEQLKKELAKTL